MNILNIGKTFKDSGVMIVLLMMSLLIKIPFDSNASQGIVSFGVSEIVIVVSLFYLLYLITKKKYRPRGYALLILGVALVSALLTLFVICYHLIVNEKSLFEFFGVVRNIYSCILIYFLSDAGKISKKELVNGIILSSFIMSIFSFIQLVGGLYFSKLSSFVFPDSIYIATASLALFPLFFREQNQKNICIIFTFTLSLTVLASIISGSRASTTLLLFELSIIIIQQFIFKNKAMISSLKSSVLIIFSVTIVLLLSPKSGYIQSGIYRSLPISRILVDNIVSFIVAGTNNDRPSETSPISKIDKQELAMNTFDFPETTTSTEEIQQVLLASSGSSMRSNNIRLSAWKVFVDKILENPLFGFGARFVTLSNDDNSVIQINPHNFIIEISALLGLIGVFAYFLLMGCIYCFLTFSRYISLYNKMLFLMFSAVIYAFAFVQPAITGGMACNIVLWSMISYMLLDRKENIEKDGILL